MLRSLRMPSRLRVLCGPSKSTAAPRAKTPKAEAANAGGEFGENSKLSTGPKTPEGKRRVSMNNLQHGFAGQTVILQEHEIPVYEKHFADFRKEYKPSGPTEEFMVHSLADMSYSLGQLRAAMTTKMTIIGVRTIPHENETHSEQTATAVSRARSINEESPSLNTLGLYEQRKQRLFMATRKELMLIQAARRAEEKASLEEASAHRKADPTWSPEENGFVHSLAEIDRYIKTQTYLNPPTKIAA
jgi:hypothetical protein